MGIDYVFLAVGLLSKFDGDMKLILYEGKKYCFFSTALPIVLHLKLLANLLNAHQLKYVLTTINYRNGASMLKPDRYLKKKAIPTKYLIFNIIYRYVNLINHVALTKKFAKQL